MIAKFEFKTEAYRDLKGAD